MLKSERHEKRSLSAGRRAGFSMVNPFFQKGSLGYEYFTSHDNLLQGIDNPVLKLTREPFHLSKDKIVNAGKDQARSLQWQRLNIARKQLPGERVAKCHWLPISSMIEIWKRDLAHYRKIMVCGSVWGCPICAGKITSGRRKELQQAINQATFKGMGIYFITFTVGHKSRHEVSYVLEGVKNATRKVKAGKAWQSIKKTFGIKGFIISTEVTFSKENGTHAHKHELILTERELNERDQEDLEIAIRQRYLNILRKSGHYATEEKAIDFRKADSYVAEYIAKYGVDPQVKKIDGINWEMTSSHTKGTRKEDHFTPFQLLDLISEGDQWASNMFQEYYKAFKGKKQLTWTPGLRNILEIENEKDDQSLSEEMEQEAELYAGMLYEEFKKIRNRPFEILKYAELLQPEDFKFLMSEIYGAEVLTPEDISCLINQEETWKEKNER